MRSYEYVFGPLRIYVRSGEQARYAFTCAQASKLATRLSIKQRTTTENFKNIEKEEMKEYGDPLFP